ncbi:uncharacterized protein LOC135098244 [Scylla paramamosain]|uniref:uncharacterized protein LOC135098244 n=1 Tax=Scylla paramamosain TaxID=85552 RepID=UPI003082767A
MSEREKGSGTPRRPPSPASGGKRREKDLLEGDGKRRKASRDSSSTQPPPACPQSAAGPSHIGDTAVPPSSEVTLDKLSTLLGALIERLDQPAVPPVSVETNFTFPHSDDEAAEAPRCLPEADPLDDLDLLTAPATQSTGDSVVDADFQKALDEFAGHFRGEEETGDPLSDRLAGILNASLRRRPSSDGVKLTCDKIKLPSNVPNLKVPATNSAITKAMSVGGKLVDTRLSLTNKLLTKALVPIACCISDIGDKKDKPVNYYLDGLNNSLRLLTSAVNYINQLRKEIARTHVNDSALAELCNWECEVGKDDLFPFDVIKKCEEIHKSRKLGRPTFRPYKAPGKRFASPRQLPSRPHSQQPRPRHQTRSFLGQRPPQGKGMPRHRAHQ